MAPRGERMAEILVNDCMRVDTGDWVVIQSP